MLRVTTQQWSTRCPANQREFKLITPHGRTRSGHSFLASMKKFHPSSFKRQSGNLLVTAVIAIGIMGIAQIGISRYTIEKTREASGSIIGSQMTALIGVMDTYTTTYGSELQKTSPVVAGVAIPLQPTVAELQALNLTTTSLPQTPYLGGDFLTQVTLTPAGCVAPLCNIKHSVRLRDPILAPDTNNVDLKILGAAVGTSKRGISFSLPDSPNVVKSAAGWSEPNPDPTFRAGILAGFSGYNESGLAAYIKRDGTQPVTTDFPMTGLDGVQYSITGAKNINASETVKSKDLQLDRIVAEGDVCPENGRLARNSAGLTLSCQSGVFRGPVSSTTTFYEIGTPGKPSAGACFQPNPISGGCYCPAGTKWSQMTGFAYHWNEWDGLIYSCIS